MLHSSVSQNELEKRAEDQQEGGLPNWYDDGPFCDVAVWIYDVNDVLGKKFLVDANSAIDSVISDISSIG